MGVEHRRPLPAAEVRDHCEKLLDLRRVAELERRLERLDDPELHGQGGDPETLAALDGALGSLERSSRLPFHPEHHRLVHVESSDDLHVVGGPRVGVRVDPRSRVGNASLPAVDLCEMEHQLADALGLR